MFFLSARYLVWIIIKKYIFLLLISHNIPVFIWISFFKQMRWHGVVEERWQKSDCSTWKGSSRASKKNFPYIDLWLFTLGFFLWWNFVSLALIFTHSSCCCSSWLFHCPIKNVFRCSRKKFFFSKYNLCWKILIKLTCRFKTSNIVVVVVVITFPACTQ